MTLSTRGPVASRRSKGPAVIAILALVVVTGGVAGPAAAQTPITCGTVITQTTTLTTDVGPCPGTGLIIGADSVVLNLNRHRVIGNPQVRGDGPDAAGIVFRQVQRSAVINGVVEGFDAGVVIGGGGTNLVIGVTARNNVNYRLVTGRNALPPEEGPYEGPECDLGDGIALFGSSNNILQNNTLSGNGPYSGVALIGPSIRNRVVGNQVLDNDLLNQPPSGEHGTICGGAPDEIGPLGRWTQDVGVRIEGPGAQYNTVSGNTILRSSLAGIMVTAFVNAFPEANNGFNQILGNTISQTGLRTHQLNDFGDEYRSSGIFLHNSGTTAVSLSYGNVIASNNSSSNFGGGIEVLGPFPGSGEVGVGGNRIIGNQAHNNALDGIILAEGTVNTTVSANAARGNAADRALIAAINARDIYTVWSGVDAADNTPGCDNNTWSRNQFGTVNQPCVLTGGGSGTVVGPPTAAQAARTAFSSSSGGGGGGNRMLQRRPIG